MLSLHVYESYKSWNIFIVSLQKHICEFLLFLIIT